MRPVDTRKNAGGAPGSAESCFRLHSAGNNDEHFLLALLDQTEGVARPLLEKIGVSVGALQVCLREELDRRPKVQAPV